MRDVNRNRKCASTNRFWNVLNKDSSFSFICTLWLRKRHSDFKIKKFQHPCVSIFLEGFRHTRMPSIPTFWTIIPIAQRRPTHFLFATKLPTTRIYINGYHLQIGGFFDKSRFLLPLIGGHSSWFGPLTHHTQS